GKVEYGVFIGQPVHRTSIDQHVFLFGRTIGLEIVDVYPGWDHRDFARVDEACEEISVRGGYRQHVVSALQKGSLRAGHSSVFSPAERLPQRVTRALKMTAPDDGLNVVGEKNFWTGTLPRDNTCGKNEITDDHVVPFGTD